jgi:hypothetical protein
MRFAVGFDRIKDRTKTVTRRIGIQYADLHPGDILRAIPVGRVRDDAPALLKVLSVRHELLGDLVGTEYGDTEAALEGYPDKSGEQLYEIVCDVYGCRFDLNEVVTRIEFEYLGDAVKTDSQQEPKP